MGVAERHISWRDLAAADRCAGIGLRHRDARVGQRRPANLREVVEPHHEPLAHAEKVRDGVERLTFAALCTLTVTGMDERELVRLARDGCGNAGVHAAAQQNHGLGGWLGRCAALCDGSGRDGSDMGLAWRPQTPCVAGSQMNLCSCKAQPHRQAIGQNPFREQARAQFRPGSLGVGKNGRKQHLPHAAREVVLRDKFAGELVIAAAGDHELDFVLGVQRLEIFHAKRAGSPESGHFTSTIFTTSRGSAAMGRSPLVSTSTV